MNPVGIISGVAGLFGCTDLFGGGNSGPPSLTEEKFMEEMNKLNAKMDQFHAETMEAINKLGEEMAKYHAEVMNAIKQLSDKVDKYHDEQLKAVEEVKELLYSQDFRREITNRVDNFKILMDHYQLKKDNLTLRILQTRCKSSDDLYIFGSLRNAISDIAKRADMALLNRDVMDSMLTGFYAALYHTNLNIAICRTIELNMTEIKGGWI